MGKKLEVIKIFDILKSITTGNLRALVNSIFMTSYNKKHRKFLAVSDNYRNFAEN
jgi:hypothetical protein